MPTLHDFLGLSIEKRAEDNIVDLADARLGGAFTRGLEGLGAIDRNSATRDALEWIGYLQPRTLTQRLGWADNPFTFDQGVAAAGLGLLGGSLGARHLGVALGKRTARKGVEKAFREHAADALEMGQNLVREELDNRRGLARVIYPDRPPAEIGNIMSIPALADVPTSELTPEFALRKVVEDQLTDAYDTVGGIAGGVGGAALGLGAGYYAHENS